MTRHLKRLEGWGIEIYDRDLAFCAISPVSTTEDYRSSTEITPLERDATVYIQYVRRLDDAESGARQTEHHTAWQRPSFIWIAGGEMRGDDVAPVSTFFNG